MKLPAEVERYLHEVVGCVGDVLGARLDSVVLGGSCALGDFVLPASDIDLVVAVHGPVEDARAAELATGASHEALPCPAAGLDLVVYQSVALSAMATPTPYELGLETGERWGTRLLPGRCRNRTRHRPGHRSSAWSKPPRTFPERADFSGSESPASPGSRRHPPVARTDHLRLVPRPDGLAGGAERLPSAVLLPPGRAPFKRQSCDLGRRTGLEHSAPGARHPAGCDRHPSRAGPTSSRFCSMRCAK